MPDTIQKKKCFDHPWMKKNVQKLPKNFKVSFCKILPVLDVFSAQGDQLKFLLFFIVIGVTWYKFIEPTKGKIELMGLRWEFWFQPLFTQTQSRILAYRQGKYCKKVSLIYPSTYDPPFDHGILFYPKMRMFAKKTGVQGYKFLTSFELFRSMF